jgi:hypothetical protein
LEKLERELTAAKRRNRWLAVVLLTIGATALAVAALSAPSIPTALAQAGGPVNEVRASRFVLVDENGKIRAKLFVNKNGPVLDMLDENGKSRIGLTTNEDGPWLGLFDEDGKLRARLGVTKVGPWLGLFDEDGKTRAELFVNNNVWGPDEFDRFDGRRRFGLNLHSVSGRTFWSTPPPENVFFPPSKDPFFPPSKDPWSTPPPKAAW